MTRPVLRRAAWVACAACASALAAVVLADRAPDEVRYYDRASLSSVFAGGGAVSAPYGGFNLEAMDAHGGWVASTVDLLRFATAVDRLPTRPDILAGATVDMMTAKPPSPLWDGSAFYYGMGWLVRPAERNWWHDGSLPGTASIMVRTMWQAVKGVTEWPTYDLFSTFP